MSLHRACGISGFVRKLMILVLVASQRISLLNDWLHTYLYFGFFSRCLYSNRLPVLLSKMELAQSQRNYSGYFRADACCALGAAFVSMRWLAQSWVMVQILWCWCVFLAGVEWLWTNSCDILAVWMGFSGPRICSSISSGGNSGWLSMRSIHNLSDWVGTTGQGNVFDCTVRTLWDCARCVSTLLADVASLALLAWCLNMLSSCVMALFMILETGIAPVIASDRMSAALINTSDGVKVGIVRYLCLKNTELQTRVLFVSGM
jgi:hypothetical protein